jgi:PAS domain S-box-containing protein
MSSFSAEQERDLRKEIASVSAKLEELRSRLEEPEEIVRAIRSGEVDAFVVPSKEGERIYNLRSADRLYRNMVEEMQEGAVILESSGLVVFANDYFARLMKVERSSLVGRSIFSFVPDESRSLFDEVLPVSNAETRRGEFALRAADGLLVPVHASLVRIEIDDGSVHCLMVSDLTPERRRAELLTQSRQKDEFLAMLAHELRNPIAPIRNATHVIALSNSAEPRIQWAKDVIERQVNQLSRLVDDLLDISRVTRGKIRIDMQSVDLGMAVARGIETAQPDIESRRHDLTVSMPNERVLVTGDATRLSQVVSNILHNSAKFTPEGGKIALTLEKTGENGRIVVRDNGVGMRRDQLSAIFELFTQGDSSLERSQGGLGIGLALVKSLVEMHGGRVEADSAGVGKGSEFSIWLPLRTESAHDASTPEPVRAPLPVARRRVLVVDDNEDSAESMALLLRELGHDVRMLTEGREVVDEAREFRPHLVLLDISLPDMSGFDVAVALRHTAELENLCLVALTGYGQEEHRRRSREAGFDHHWTKPIELDLLEKLLSSLPS